MYSDFLNVRLKDCINVLTLKHKLNVVMPPNILSKKLYATWLSTRDIENKNQSSIFSFSVVSCICLDVLYIHILKIQIKVPSLLSLLCLVVHKH